MHTDTQFVGGDRGGTTINKGSLSKMFLVYTVLVLIGLMMSSQGTWQKTNTSQDITRQEKMFRWDSVFLALSIGQI